MKPPRNMKEAGAIGTFICIASLILLVFATPSNADVTFLGSTAYVSAADSPFSGLDFEYFHLEDFEDFELNTPGVTRSGGTIGEEARAYRDSVDGDDGAIDGLGTEGESLFVDRGSSLWDWVPWSDADATSITFTFDLDALGAFPSHVGVVWTDGEAPKNTSVFLEAFGPTGMSLGTFGPHPVGDTTTQGTTPEDRFLGVVYLDGISAIRIFQYADQMEVDHLQYGHLEAEAPDQAENLD